MAARRDFPVSEAEILAAARCSRCGKQIVWKRPITYSRDIPLQVSTRERGTTGEWRLEPHFGYCTGKARKPRKRHGGTRSVGSDERSYC